MRSINKDCLYRGGIETLEHPTHTPHIVSQGSPFDLWDLEGVTRADNGRDTKVLLGFGPAEATKDRRETFGVSVVEATFRHLEDFFEDIVSVNSPFVGDPSWLTEDSTLTNSEQMATFHSVWAKGSDKGVFPGVSGSSAFLQGSDFEPKVNADKEFFVGF